MTRPACSAGRSIACAQAVLVEGADEVEAALHQPAEARVLSHLHQTIPSQREEHRSPS